MCVPLIKLKIRELQNNNKKLIPFLDEIAFIQEALHVDLGLSIAEHNYWAPRRYFFEDKDGNEINFHPLYGIKRYQGTRCEKDLSLLIELISKIEIYLQDVVDKLEKIEIPEIKWEKMPILKKIITHEITTITSN
jgi:hypothetical protein